MTIYEQTDQAVELAYMPPCWRCGRRSYVAKREWDEFPVSARSGCGGRCAGCGYPVSGCPCADARVRT